MIASIRTASRELVRELGMINGRFGEIGSPSQCHALVELDLHKGLGITALGELLNLEKSTTSRLVKDLVDAGMCTLEAQQSDKRHKLVTLTKRGQKSVAHIHKSAEKQVIDALENMSLEEKTLVLKGLALYAQALKTVRRK